MGSNGSYTSGSGDDPGGEPAGERGTLTAGDLGRPTDSSDSGGGPGGVLGPRVGAGGSSSSSSSSRRGLLIGLRTCLLERVNLTAGSGGVLGP